MKLNTLKYSYLWLKPLFNGFDLFQEKEIGREVIAVSAPVRIPVPGPHRVAFVTALVLYQVLLIKNMGLVIKETGLLFFQPGL